MLRLRLLQLGRLPLRPTVHLILTLQRPDLPLIQRCLLQPHEERERSTETNSKWSQWVSRRRRLSNKSRASCKYLTSLQSVLLVLHESKVWPLGMKHDDTRLPTALTQVYTQQKKKQQGGTFIT